MANRDALAHQRGTVEASIGQLCPLAWLGRCVWNCLLLMSLHDVSESLCVSLCSLFHWFAIGRMKAAASLLPGWCLPLCVRGVAGSLYFFDRCQRAAVSHSSQEGTRYDYRLSLDCGARGGLVLLFKLSELEAREYTDDDDDDDG
jgi:hypothetical protein